MRVKLADRIGFCFGVKRAIHMAEAALKERKKVYSLGSIIHNSQVVESLAGKGLAIIKDLDETKGGAVLISSHGAPPEIFKKIKARGIEIIDTTCPFVLHAQRIAGEMAREGYDVIIVGDQAHPEVKAIVGSASGRGVVISDKDDPALADLGCSRKVAAVAQTTQRLDNLFDVAGRILKKRPREMRIFNTICSDTGRRQETVSDLSMRVDAMIIIGGRHSANTNRLFEVCKNECESHLVETEADLREEWFSGRETIGIASGASTPAWVIKKVVNMIENLKTKSVKRKVKV